MNVKTLKALEREIEIRIKTALATDVAKAVSDVMVDHIVQDVYDAYEPFQYERRWDEGGLLDPDNIQSTLIGDTLIIENMTVGNPYIGGGMGISKNDGQYIAGIIETGVGYDTKFNMKRPFIHNTKYDLFTHKYHVSAMKQGLKRLGLEVK